MASHFGNTLKNVRNAFNGSGKYLSGKNKFLTGNIVNKSAPSLTSDTKHGIHVSAKQDYPAAEPLPLPFNIDPTESTRFSPQRARDITATAIATNIWNRIDITVDSTDMMGNSDPHLNSYDCTGSVSLNSSMQSNVPSPFGGMHKFTHLNMPGGQWEQSNKWMSHDLHSSHYTTLRREARKNWSKYPQNESKQNLQFSADKGSTISDFKHNMHGLLSSKLASSSSSSLPSMMIAHCVSNNRIYAKSILMRVNAMQFLLSSRSYSVKSNTPKTNIAEQKEIDNLQSKNNEDVVLQTNSNQLSPKDKLKKAIKDYGITVILFHVSISLASLGLFYQLVASGLDVVAIIDYLGLGKTMSTVSSNVTAGASTFVIAYAVHKVFAPIRISITLVSAPFIVRVLRKRGILKTKPSKITEK